MTRHPYRFGCEGCGSTRVVLQKTGTTYGKYTHVYCQACGHKSDTVIDKKNSEVINYQRMRSING